MMACITNQLRPAHRFWFVAWAAGTWGLDAAGGVAGEAAHMHLVHHQVLHGQVQGPVALPVEGGAGCREGGSRLGPGGRQAQHAPGAIPQILQASQGPRASLGQGQRALLLPVRHIMLAHLGSQHSAGSSSKGAGTAACPKR